MFVSSYKTYVNTTATQRVQKEREDSSKTKSSSFENRLNKINSETPNSVQAAKAQLPVNYISNYKSLNNQQKLQQETAQDFSKTKFTKISTVNSAQIAYTNNSKIFSFYREPKVTLDQTPKLDKKLSTEALKGQEKTLRHQMINTYIANENYYKITA